MHIPKVLLLALMLFTACNCTPTTQTAGVAADCIDPSKINPQGMCTMDYKPVCGCDGKTYGNACVATNAGVRTYTVGRCPDAAK